MELSAAICADMRKRETNLLRQRVLFVEVQKQISVLRMRSRSVLITIEKADGATTHFNARRYANNLARFSEKPKKRVKVPRFDCRIATYTWLALLSRLGDSPG